MKIKNVKLEWYVLNHDFNSDTIVNYNVLSDCDKEAVGKAIRKKEVTCYDELYEFLRRRFVYQFMGRAEYEIAVGGLSSKYPDKFDKIDVYRQIKMNLNHITDYIIKVMDIKF